jgi:type IV pilus assembly protein PilQ
VKALQGMTQIWMTGIMSAAALMTALPASAAAQVTAVQLNPTASGVNVLLQTKGADRPQVFSVNRGNSWTADLVNTTLQIPNGSFKQANPAPGIAMVTVAPLDRTSVRVTVTGKGNTAPSAQVTRGEGTLTLSFNPNGAKQAAAKPSAKPAKAPTIARNVSATALPSLPSAPATAPANLPAISPPLATGNTAAPLSIAQADPQQQQVAQATPSPLPAFQGGTPLVPNPNITVDGRKYTPPAPVPPNAPIPQPRAIAPPVGDIAVGQLDISPGAIDLGTAERIPRLVLRDASAREALAVLARASGLNIIYVPPKLVGSQRAVTVNAGDEEDTKDRSPKITLDIQNEPVQNVFNYILQTADLEANRVGRTIFVSPRLPDTARNLVSRTLRLNQATAAAASAYLSSLGASTLRSVEVVRIEQVGQPPNARFVETRDTQIRPLEAQEGTAPLLLRGVTVAVDERMNSVTLVGSPRKIEVATAVLSQLDARRRQVAVNVRVIDIDLLAFDRVGTSLSFGLGDTQFASTGGIAALNFGRNVPGSIGLSAPLDPGGTVGTAPTLFGGGPASNLLNFSKRFLLQVQAAVTNGSAKILTDPTLVVQEGQQSQVQLAQEVITNIKQQVTATQNSTQITVEVEKAPAGLTLPVRIEKIDDNGFITLQVNPEITRPERTVNISFTNQGQTVTNPITLLAKRIVNSGQVRLRDGQTLLLTGIIQDDDRTTVTKIPILGDIPILGALFRRTEKQNQRREVVVMLTPRILDDSDRSAFGYSYSPGAEVRKILENTQPGGR